MSLGGMSARVAITRRDLGLADTLASWGDVAELTPQLPLYETCLMLSVLAQVATPHNLDAAQSELLPLIEPPTLRSRVGALLQQPGRMFFHPYQVLAGWRELVLHGRDDDGSSYEDFAKVGLFWQWLLRIADALAQDEASRYDPNDTDIVGDAMLSILTTSGNLFDRDEPWKLLARHYELLDATVQQAFRRELKVVAGPRVRDRILRRRCRLAFAARDRWMAVAPGGRSTTPDLSQRRWMADPGRGCGLSLCVHNASASSVAWPATWAG